MQTGLQAEVLLCPNCKEEVPKTLYCLNCGYPLYKIDLDQPEEDVEVVVDEALEPVEDEAIVKVETIEDVVIMVEDMAASPALKRRRRPSRRMRPSWWRPSYLSRSLSSLRRLNPLSRSRLSKR
jgi:hypothetical protein